MKILTISDTHNLQKHLNIPNDIDMIIHAGDFSHYEIQATKFLEWYSSLNIKYKILVSGNHDFYVKRIGYEAMKEECEKLGIIYLENSGVEIKGLKIWGSPYSNIFGSYAFMLDDFELAEIWDEIPVDTNILITHGPAYNIGDRVNNSYGSDRHVGSRSLQNRILELPELKYHIFGHIHEGYGIYEYQNKFISINASMMNTNELYNVNEPIVFQI